MKFLQLTSAIALLVATAGTGMSQETYQVDQVHSSVLFRIKHFNTTYVYGRFNEVSGTFQIDQDAPEKSKIEVTVNTASIDTANADRDKHLKTADFFDTEKFPKAVFKSTSVKAGEKENTLAVTGDLTICDVTKPVTVTLELTGEGETPFNDYRKGLATKLKVNRSDFGIDFMPGGLGEEVLVIISLQGIRN